MQVKRSKYSFITKVYDAHLFVLLLPLFTVLHMLITILSSLLVADEAVPVRRRQLRAILPITTGPRCDQRDSSGREAEPHRCGHAAAPPARVPSGE